MKWICQAYVRCQTYLVEILKKSKNWLYCCFSIFKQIVPSLPIAVLNLDVKLKPLVSSYYSVLPHNRKQLTLFLGGWVAWLGWILCLPCRIMIFWHFHSTFHLPFGKFSIRNKLLSCGMEKEKWDTHVWPGHWAGGWLLTGPKSSGASPVLWSLNQMATSAFIPWW